MNTYYIAGFPVSDELYHFGIQGQKWGIRRYQNEDGTLTPAGRERYGKNLGEYGTKKQGVIRKFATGDWVLGSKRLGERREQSLNRRIEKRKAEGKSTEKLERAHAIQKARNVGRDIYNSKASTGKLVVQNLLVGEFGADAYRSAIGRGKSKGEALFGALVGPVLGVPIVSLAFDYSSTKEQLEEKSKR